MVCTKICCIAPVSKQLIRKDKYVQVWEEHSTYYQFTVIAL